MTPEERNNHIEKIRRLRAKGKDDAVPKAEADIFGDRAKDLMQKHGITEEEVRAAEAAHPHIRSKLDSERKANDGTDDDRVNHVQTFFVEMEIDPVTGAMTGRILAGSEAGKMLADLSVETIISLLPGIDDDSRDLLKAYLDWRHPGWSSAIAPGPGQTGSAWSTPPHPTFPDLNKDGHPKQTFRNALKALEHLPVKFAADLFHGTVLETRAGENPRKFDDNSTIYWRDAIMTTFGFDPGKGHVHDAIVTLGGRNKFDPVLDSLNNLPAWDGKPRLDTWLIDYCHVADTPLVREQGKLWLLAMVRRQKEPGAKFDYMPILEGSEGIYKSTLCELLAGGSDFFSDQTIMGLADTTQQERLTGTLIYEVAELVGMSETKVGKLKTFVTRRWDKTRLAYHRVQTEAGRRTILVGTTNETHGYLKSDTGNRRFWPLVVPGKIDIEGFKRDRDQLFAEAKLREPGADLFLSPEFSAQAEIIAETRREVDPFEDDIVNIPAHLIHAAFNDKGEPVERVRADELAAYLKINYHNRTNQRRMGEAMRRNNAWAGPTTARVEGKMTKAFTRPVAAKEDGYANAIFCRDIFSRVRRGRVKVKLRSKRWWAATGRAA